MAVCQQRCSVPKVWGRGPFLAPFRGMTQRYDARVWRNPFSIDFAAIIVLWNLLTCLYLSMSGEHGRDSIHLPMISKTCSLACIYWYPVILERLPSHSQWSLKLAHLLVFIDVRWAWGGSSHIPTDHSKLALLLEPGGLLSRSKWSLKLAPLLVFHDVLWAWKVPLTLHMVTQTCSLACIYRCLVSLEYNGISWNIVELYGISRHHGLSWNISEYNGITHRISWNSMEYHNIMVCVEASLNIMKYRGISWNIVEFVEYHNIMVCLGASLNIMQCRGISWKSVEYHNIMVCLGVSLNIMEYRRISSNIVESHNIMVCLGVSWNIME